MSTIQAFPEAAYEATNVPTPLPTLAWELRLLCQGLAHTQVKTLETVSTVVRLPEDPTQIVALRRICAWLANEFTLDHDVSRDGAVWAVRFSLPPAPVPAHSTVRPPSRLLALRSSAARLFDAAWHPVSGQAHSA